ncbi:type II toxin-antitoxin system Phd/YefM family antitoxin [Candidatus Allofournierella merdipullorum]|uniref:type II toxin-antitoxin system Phd/YefM family antitoxin n=1 Tax=Candidatus Allofournierella merdipullorum TaxID=2838595 RepID=UPI00374E2DE8
MFIDTQNMVSMTEANRNFSRVARLVDERGAAVILKNNSPKYVVLEYDQYEATQMAAEDEVLKASKQLMEQNQAAYEVLAK